MAIKVDGLIYDDPFHYWYINGVWPVNFEMIKDEKEKKAEGRLRLSYGDQKEGAETRLEDGWYSGRLESRG